ncbi:MAG: type II toxin-antitoxin system RelE/ParE family toxin [Nitrospirae bacterium]|nr:type II toxin-antitoxin system RelE/ParE family toxin [Nitrospirota bacterium]
MCAITHSNKCLVELFIDTLPVSEQKKIFALLRRTAEHGTLKNEQKFKKLENNIFEFKADQVRVFCFFDKGKLIILTHGFLKKSQKAPKSEIKQAKHLMEEYFRKKERTREG